ncbi:TPA: hypothetical protein N0F65_000747 [Lagenidium giganteum]|uniref:RING-type domain-containing protein n=1 Tax=Lagenidium giganteum TaxID=4803 RepID=A0AAV2ZKV4_9STRA|nr:TPA: hypothetical protein N0F65_000747 [Lagenidium giganteum]
MTLQQNPVFKVQVTDEMEHQQSSGSSNNGAMPVATATPWGGSTSTQPPLNDQAIRQEEARRAVRMHVLSSTMDGAREGVHQSRPLMFLLTLLTLPQIIACVVVLALKWNVAPHCNYIQLWVLVRALHLTVSLSLDWTLYFLNGDLSYRTSRWRERHIALLSSLQQTLYLAGLFWFMVGNVWVISDGGGHCQHDTAMYHLALVLIIVTYARIFFPCLVLIALLPLICCCLPRVIRFLQQIQYPTTGHGATHSAIDQLRTEKYVPDGFPHEERMCCICLNEYEPLQDLRFLPCNHHFHKSCVDSWLVVSATCPTCRKSINDRGSTSSTQSYQQEAFIV